MGAPRAGSLALPALVFLLPFEPRRPILPLLGFQLTLLEAAAGVMGAVLLWSVRRRVPSLLRRPPLPLAFLGLYAAAHVLSAAFAPAHRDLAARFALRMLVMAGLAVAVAAAPPETGRRAVVALVASAAAVAVLAVAEGGGWQAIDPFLSHFREMPFNIGAEIMGRNKFGPQRGPWENLDWTGWWGDEPPFRTPVFVLTHHVRPSITLSDTTFHFIDTDPADALRQAKEAAGGKDVRLGGGVATVREFIDAGLVDTMHISVAPIDLGRGERLWTSPDELLDRYHLDTVPTASGVTHLLFWRR